MQIRCFQLVQKGGLFYHTVSIYILNLYKSPVKKKGFLPGIFVSLTTRPEAAEEAVPKR